ncbi:hypothetical protein [Nonomuraea sp. NPDC049129]|uniref:hypothetical protein n=1 Tax=Nonomuraea sp. NPDC049129 TaxID=3155272 RepID=UPI0033CF776E
MSGCGLKGRAVVEVYENGMSVHDYDHWVKNFISVHRGIAEGRLDPEFADWSGTEFYIKEAGSTDLVLVGLEANEHDDETVHVRWHNYDYDTPNGVPYLVDGTALGFSFDLYEGLDRYTLTVVPRESADEPMPEGWNGKWIFAESCPLWGVPEPKGMWAWVDSHTLGGGVSGDVLVTPHGEETGVENPIATREIAVRRNG